MLWKTEMLIAFEGLEGSGKTTLGREVATAISAAYLKTPPVEMNACRGFIADTALPHTSFYFYLSSLYAVQPEIAAIIAEGRPVIVDRYLASTIAYHAGGESFEPPEFDRLGLRKPNLVVHIRCSEEVRLERLSRRGFHIFDRMRCNELAICHYFSAVSNMSFDNDLPLDQSVAKLSATLSKWLAQNV